MYVFETRNALLEFIQNEIISTAEAIKILGCSRQNLDDLVKRGKLTPVKTINFIRLYLKSDILQRANKKASE